MCSHRHHFVEGDNPQNTSFTGKARKWLCFMCDKCFER